MRSVGRFYLRYLECDQLDLGSLDVCLAPAFWLSIALDFGLLDVWTFSFVAQQSAIINWSQYLALRTLSGLMQCFDAEENLHTAARFGTMFHRFNRMRRERAENNIALSFPHWPYDRVREVALKSVQHMFQLFMVEAMISPRLITPASWSKYVRLGKIGPVLEFLVRGEPVIFITGHCGNWELLGTAMASIGYPMIALARPLDNPLINQWLLSVREVRGQKIITKWGATPILQDTLNSGGRVGFIADQNAGDQGLFVPFFARLASSYKSIALLAMHHNVPVIAGYAVRIGEQFLYEIDYTDIILPSEWADQADPLFYITARYNRAIETMIRRDPTQYLWLHRRWKSRPKHERLGQPIPTKLIDKIAALPWMTQAELDRIVKGEAAASTS
jgi:KDO2-lipid IV(A) lauroyltransferase